MRLPGVEKAEVSETKLIKYLLSTTHRAGKSKATFFMEFRFDPARSEELERALRQHATDNDIAREEKTRFGTRYVIDGLLQAPDGRMLNVRTACFINSEGGAPRFITSPQPLITYETIGVTVVTPATDERQDLLVAEIPAG
jgi:hypothetical protein